MLDSEKKIFVYVDCGSPKLMGTIYVNQTHGSEVYSFEYSDYWLKEVNIQLDPELYLYHGRQFVSSNKKIWGIFSDSCPDRWGRLLMRRREAINARKANTKPKKLNESDYLLGVYDETRMGALRFKSEESDDFLANEKDLATPPWTTLRELEAASRGFESDENGTEEKWINQLLAPGSSLGGARPKATVQDPDHELWIAKFPSKNDEWNIGAWEMVTHDLAVLCKLNVPEAKLETFSSTGSTFLVKRFDRRGSNRLCFVSAMTLLCKEDGASAVDGSSYLEMADFIKANGSNPQNDLEELWKRIVFSIAVSNTDDHFRNHGFIWNNNGWSLSPMYDVNPNIYGTNLSLNINEDSSDLSFSLALKVCQYFSLSDSYADEYIEKTKSIISENWKKVAEKYNISRQSILNMSPAFNMDYKE